MKKLIIVSVAMLYSSVMFSQNVTVIFSQNKCYFNKTGEVTKMWKEEAASILNDLVKQEKLINWGVLTHAWGDEWNWNVYYVAKDLNAFNDAWGEFLKIWTEKNPDAFTRFGEMCFEHKDSIYTEAIGYNTPSEDDSDE